MNKLSIVHDDIKLDVSDVNIARIYNKDSYTYEYVICGKKYLSQLENDVNRHNDWCDYYGHSYAGQELEYLFIADNNQKDPLA